MPSLRELCFNQNIVGDGVVEAFSKNLSSNLPLEKFVFSGNASRKDIGDDFASIIKSCPNLRHLDLSYSGLGDEEMKAVIDALKFVPHLKSLNLSGCKLTQISMTYLCEKLSCIHELVSLSLENNIDIGAEGVKALAEGLHKVPRLESLSLHDVNRNTDSAKETSRVIYTSLGQAFAHCPRLTRLDMSANLLHQGKFVGDCIKMAPKLISLDLSGNAFQDEGVESLAEVLPCLQGLSELSLNRNYITCNGLTSLCESYKELEARSRRSCGFTEEKLHKCYVSLKEDTFKLLMTSAHAHSSLEGIYLSQTAIPKGTDPQDYPRLRLIGQYK
ncbi:NLR, CARD domain containing 5 [Desmophyllum pertusum]|uniref:NLR, CARD domain containing 5 n=1 Tax=Desmophyllum pertusum TaxID=174260 RepID=A0A9W9Z4E5_9CNID|nr:NLR, CARD domain containing 5 [Desmophyllum pertusum]